MIARLVRSSAPWFAVVTALILAFEARFQVADYDLWGRLAAAMLWRQSGHAPFFDTLSFTAFGRPWVDHEWLASLVFDAVLRWGGEPALLVLKDVMLAACVAIVFRLHRIHGVAPALTALAVLAVSPITHVGFASVLRCQVFSFLFALVTVWRLERLRVQTDWTPRRRGLELCGLAILGILWGNLHGGFAVGMLVVLCYGAGAFLEGSASGRWRALWPFGACVAATFGGLAVLNPFGARYLAFLVKAWAFDRSDVSEWRPLWPVTWDRAGVVALCAALLGLVGWRLRRQAGRRGPFKSPGRQGLFGPSLVLVLAVVMAVRAYRFQTFLAFLALALVPAFTPLLKASRERLTPGRLRVEFCGLVAIGAAAILLFISPESHPLRAWVRAESYPLGPVEYLRATGATGNVAAPFGPSEFVAWRTSPRLRVAVDGRFEEVYGLDEARPWIRFFRTETADASLKLGTWPRAQGADWVIAPKRPGGAAASIELTHAWVKLVDDGEYVLYGQPGAPAAAELAAADGSRRGGPRSIADFVQSISK